MVQGREENGKLIIALSGRINSMNREETEKQLKALRDAYPCESIVLDCDQLEYVTSAGLQIILRLKQRVDDTVLINVHPALYNVFDITGFPDMMEVRKAGE